MKTFQAKTQAMVAAQDEPKITRSADLRVTGHEFVFVGVTRGDPRASRMPLNPASSADLDGAIMGLDLNEPAGSGLEGVRDWTLGTPVSMIYP